MASIPPLTGRSSEAHGSDVGAAIRQARVKQGLPLRVLSQRAGVSTGMLSQIERNLTNPSFRILARLHKALGVPAGMLLSADPAASTPDFVRRANERPRLDLGFFGKEILSPQAPHNLQLAMLHIPPNGSSGETELSYPAEKGGIVLDGHISLKVGDQVSDLHPGDGFVFDGILPHSFRNTGTVDAHVVWIIAQLPIDRHL